MKKRSMKLMVTCLFLTTAIVWLNGCKKTNNDVEHEQQKIQEKSIELLKQKISDEGQKLILAENKKAVSYFGDEEGNNLLTSNPSGRLLTTCVDENDEPILQFDEAVLESCTRSFVCGEGYRVQSTWVITTALPVDQSISKGRLRLKNISGTVVYTNITIQPVSITTLTSTDPNFPNSTMYRVKYESPVITQAIFQSAITLENGVTLGTNCDPYPTTTQGYQAAYSIYIGSSSVSPCSRIDVVSVNPPNSGFYGGIGGCNAGANCNDITYTLPNGHEVEFIPISGGAVAKTVTIANWDLKAIVPVTPPSSLPSDNSVQVHIFTGTYQLRYRNSHSCSPAAPWSQPTASIAF